MGKRKERRLAAMSNAGRRVKLDLFAEPSEGLGGSSAREGVTEDLDLEHRVGLPNSPSSSESEHSGDILLGQPENPLLLLGQYSDDEFEAQSSKSDDDLAVLTSLANDNDQVKGNLAEDCKNIDTNAVVGLTAQTVEQKGQERDSTLRDGIHNTEANGAGEIDATAADPLCKEMYSTGQDSVLGISAMQDVDVYSGWKMVMDEESNQYYYWNTETGETSWDIPKALAQGTELTFEQKILPITKGNETVSLGNHESSSNLVEAEDSSAVLTLDAFGGANLISEAGKSDEQNGKILESGNQGDESDKKQIRNGSASGSYPYGDTPFAEHWLYSEKSGDALLVNGESAGIGSNGHQHEIVTDGEHRTGIYISSGLIKHGECLLDKLKSLKWSEGCLQGGHDWVSKYVMEIEVRLSDIRALLSYGSSLLPFWEYSERRFKQLELAMNDEIVHASKTNLSETPNNSAIKGADKPMESVKLGNEADGPVSGAACSSEPSVVSPNVVGTSLFQKYSHNEAPNNDVNSECVTPSGYSIAHLDDPAGANGKEICNQAGLPGELVPKSGFHVGEDEDMDVDMEVEDAIPAINTIFEDTFHTEAFALPQESAVHQPNPLMGYAGLIAEDGSIVPPPPDEEWIPPPPPEDELVPPPPPDEPEPSCPLPPSYSDDLPPSYAEPYKLSYPNSNFEYYGQTVTEVPSGNIYGHHMSVLHQPVYYEVIPSTYANAAPTLVNPIGTVAPIPVVAGAESSAFQTHSGSEMYGGLLTSQIGSFTAISDMTTAADVSAVADVAVIPNVPAIANVSSMVSLDGPITSTLAQTIAASSVIESVPVPSVKVATTSSSATPSTSMTAKIGSKGDLALRSKKRTISVAPSLRSNKKVSKLVDKWKAAKEELHEDDEDEAENSFDFMEKKRQREIEQWRAQQIASGEARDNANFQPLGGNWRERVKRRKGARETVAAPSEVVDNENQQPDLTALCRDLPSGWQACWDESSRQVYYANIATSETTWTKPTK